jgi:membrane dipeptidase
VLGALERSLNRVGQGPYAISSRARELHRELLVADLHADSLLWGRDLLRRSRRGAVDVPRLIEGNVALQVFAASTQVPLFPRLTGNDGRSDAMPLLALAARWPRAAWHSRLARAVLLADRARDLEARSGGRFTLIRSGADLARYVERRAAEPAITAGLLAIEGAHALDGDLVNLDALVAAGYRMMSITHLADNAFGGSAHGRSRGGLTSLGRTLITRLDAASVLVDVAHASRRTVDDVLAIATRPVVASHTGVVGTCDSIRNLADDQLRGIVATGGLVGIGFWPTATCGRDAASIARAISHAARVVGPQHVALGSDFDGGVAQPFDASGLAVVTDALLAEGFGDGEVARIMGGSVVELLRRVLPGGSERSETVRAPGCRDSSLR